MIRLIIASIFVSSIICQLLKNGCEPNVCKNNSKCLVDPKNKSISICVCAQNYTGKFCELNVGCFKKPCLHGTCENLKHNMTLHHCTCDKDYVGMNCNTKNPCLDKKNSCSSPLICRVDIKSLKSFCACPNGFIGKKCDQKNCPVVEFKNGKNFATKPKIFIDYTLEKKMQDLSSLAKQCTVIIQQIRTFANQYNLSSTIEYKDFPLYIGRGLQFELLDKDGNLYCNSLCLSKNPIPLQAAKCFMEGLKNIGWHHSLIYPGIIHDGFHLNMEISEYIEYKEFIQIGCSKK